jgi:hypothetical protein
MRFDQTKLISALKSLLAPCLNHCIHVPHLLIVFADYALGTHSLKARSNSCVAENDGHTAVRLEDISVTNTLITSLDNKYLLRYSDSEALPQMGDAISWHQTIINLFNTGQMLADAIHLLNYIRERIRSQEDPYDQGCYTGLFIYLIDRNHCDFIYPDHRDRQRYRDIQEDFSTREGLHAISAN